MTFSKLEDGSQCLLERFLNAMALGLLLLLLYQFTTNTFTQSYVDDTSNYFLSREYFERFTPFISVVGVLGGWFITSIKFVNFAVIRTAFLLCLVSAAIISRHYLGFAAISNPWTNDFFGGFGIRVLFIVVLLSVVWTLREEWKFQDLSNGMFRELFVLLSSLLIFVFYLPASIVTSQSIFHSDFTYVLNEMLGPQVDHAPLVSAVPQYSSLLGWPLRLLSQLSVPLFIEVSIIYISVLFLLILLAITKVVRGLFPQIPIACAVLVPVSILLARPPGKTSGSFIMFPSAVVRNVLPILAIWLFHICMKRRSIACSTTLGIFVAVMGLNNLEFGLISAIAITASVLYGAAFGKVPMRLAVAYFLALLVGFVILVMILGLNTYSWWSFKFFATAYGSGNNNIPMPLFGLHSLTMTISALAVTVGAYDLYSIRKSDQFGYPAAHSLVLLASGLAATGFHLYYTGRSMVSTQLQTELPMLIICGVILVHRLRVFKVNTSNGKHVLNKLPILIIAFLPLGALLLAPDPTIEMSRLQGRLPESEYGSFKLGFSQVDLSDFSSFIKQARSEFSESSIGIVADHNGNALSLIHGLPNLLPFNDMNDITDITTDSQSAVCDAIGASNVDYVAIEKDDNSVEAHMFVRTCTSLEKLPILESPFGVLLKIRDANL